MLDHATRKERAYRSDVAGIGWQLARDGDVQGDGWGDPASEIVRNSVRRLFTGVGATRPGVE